ncbi:amidohydrolase [Staphylococcus sp. 17KM0847]|uniref:amidohydrolase n=1 Tax=Staphylococcus sp. 17KM0847 TaxID=2583989 RepID=UPI0015DD10E2|nr:amidohydrolase [Staphylococcus sp. 17KM0847]QLK86686.1 amidohydrolase [Staphylococcus sp. 17KM0847]
MTALLEQLKQWRRDFHRLPELSNKEVQTTARIRDILEQHDIRILNIPFQTGLIAEVGQGHHCIGVRTDIDALPIEEQTEVPYISQRHGIMHACGHDVHMAAILGTAIQLKQREVQLSGRVRFIFQAAEEVSEGADAVVRTGALDGVKAIIGFHNDPTLKIGEWRAKVGAMTANVDRFKINITGVGAHAAMPQDGVDPHIAIGQLINSLQTITSRSIAPYDEAVVTIGQIHCGETWNVIPNSGFIEGTVRTLSSEVRETIAQRMQQLCDGLAIQFGAKITLDYQRLTDGVDNDSTLHTIAQKAADQVGYNVTLQPRAQMIGEDFASYQQIAPVHFAMIGSDSHYPLHHPQYEPNEAILDKVPDYFVEFVEQLLVHYNLEN